MNLEQAIDFRYGNQNESVERTTLTVREVAEYLGLSVDIIYKLVREKKIPFIKIGARILFKKVSLDKWIETLEYTPEV